jgi:hypothetical protein
MWIIYLEMEYKMWINYLVMEYKMWIIYLEMEYSTHSILHLKGNDPHFILEFEWMNTSFTFSTEISHYLVAIVVSNGTVGCLSRFVNEYKMWINYLVMEYKMWIIYLEMEYSMWIIYLEMEYRMWINYLVMEYKMQNDKKYIKQMYHIWEKWIMWHCDTEYNQKWFPEVS